MSLPMYIQGFSASKINKLIHFKDIHWTQEQLSACTTKELYNQLVEDTFHPDHLMINNIPNSLASQVNEYGCGYGTGDWNNTELAISNFEYAKSQSNFILTDVPLFKTCKCTVYIPYRYTFYLSGIYLYNKTKNILSNTRLSILEVYNSHSVSSGNWHVASDGFYIDSTVVAQGYRASYTFDIDVSQCTNILAQHTEGDLYYLALLNLGAGNQNGGAYPVIYNDLHITF